MTPIQHAPVVAKSPQHLGQWSTAAAVLLAAAVMLPLLGHRPLASWDEGIYAEVSREMLGHSWLAPTWNLQPWLEKPPLMLWITALFFKLFGVGEFTARLGSAVSGVAVAGVLHGWARRVFGETSAWLSTLILLSTFGFLRVAGVGEFDTLLTLGCVLAVIGLTDLEAARPRGWYLFWVGFAIAAMTKGAASVVLPLTLSAVALLARWSLRSTRACLLGGLGFLAAVLPWHLAMWHRFGPVFLREYLGYHVLVRAIQPIENHATPAWYFLWVLLVTSPFAPLFPFTLAPAFRRTGDRRNLRPWAVFALVILVLYTAARTRLPHYIAPVYPALSLLTAAWLANRLAHLRAAYPARRVWPAFALCALAVYGIAALLTNHPRHQLHVARSGGALLHDDRESIPLLRDHAPQWSAVPGPLLVWRDGPATSIATCVFYARRAAEPVTLVPAQIHAEGDRYTYAPQTLAEAVPAGPPHLILLDKSLLPALPPGLVYAPVATSVQMELGLIRRSGN